MKNKHLTACGLLVILLCAMLAPPTAAASPKVFIRGGEDRGVLPWTTGPAEIDLGHEIDLRLPESYAFMGMPHAAKALEERGELPDDALAGIVIPSAEHPVWMIVLRYEEKGHFRDDEPLDADELFSAMHDTTEADNDEFINRGVKPLHLDAWSDPPLYDRTTHRLTFGLVGHDESGAYLNYLTRVLGRRGYASVNLATAPTQFNETKRHAAVLLAAIHFRPGAQYGDFDPAKDRVADGGLPWLVLSGVGVSGAKLVKLGVMGKLWKVVGRRALLACPVIGFALLGWFFGVRRRRTAVGARE